MVSSYVDGSELEEFAERMMRFYLKEFPRETRNYLQREGNELKKQLRQNTIATIQNPKTGNLAKASNYSRERAVEKSDGFQVRVKNTAPHAWLFEHGHEIYTYDQHLGQPVSRGRRAEARNPASYTKKSFDRQFMRDTLKFVDDMLEEL